MAREGEATDASAALDRMRRELDRMRVLDDGLVLVEFTEEAEEPLGLAPRVLLGSSAVVVSALASGGISSEASALALRTSVERLRPHGPSLVLGESLIALAYAARDLQTPSGRAELLAEAFAVFQGLAETERSARVLAEVAALLRDTGFLYDAATALQRAGELLEAHADRAGLSVCRYYQATIRRGLGLEVEALHALDEALELLAGEGRRARRLRTWIRLERIDCALALDRRATAERDVRSLLADDPDDWQALAKRSRLALARGDRRAALEDGCAAALRARRALLGLRTEHYRRRAREQIDGVFDATLGLALRAGEPDTALGLIEVGHTGGAALLGTALRGGADLLVERSRALEARLLALVDDAGRALEAGDPAGVRRAAERAEWALAERELLASGPDSRPALAGLEPAALGADLRARLPEGTLLIEYAVSSGELWVLCATREDATLARCELSIEQLQRLSASMLDELLERAPTPSLDTLASRLLQPARAWIDRATSLLIAPGDRLAHVPFHALAWGGEPLGSTRRLGYLAAASSLSSAPAGRPVAAGPGAWCRFLGVPAVSFAGHEPLPGVREEELRVRRLLGDERVACSSPATSADLLSPLQGVACLHVACHAEPEPDAPLSSRLLLHDRPVFAFEVLAAHLDVDVALLFACQTAESSVATGGHARSLATAFLRAGARSVVGSLWALGDDASACFTELLYRVLLEGETPSAAVQAAQRAMRAMPDFGHPGDWAPFVAYTRVDRP